MWPTTTKLDRGKQNFEQLLRDNQLTLNAILTRNRICAKFVSGRYLDRLSQSIYRDAGGGSW